MANTADVGTYELDEMTQETVQYEYVKKNLVCEFDRYDQCLKGVIIHKGQLWYAEVSPDDDSHHPDLYVITPAALTRKHLEFLHDYRDTFHNCLYDDDGNRPQFDGRTLEPWKDKWEGKNPFK